MIASHNIAYTFERSSHCDIIILYPDNKDLLKFQLQLDLFIYV